MLHKTICGIIDGSPSKATNKSNLNGKRNQVKSESPLSLPVFLRFKEKLTYQLVVKLSVPTYNAIQFLKAVHLVEWKVDSGKRFINRII